MKYNKASSRLKVQFIDSDSEEVLFEIKDRNWMNVGEILTDHAVTNIMQNELREDQFPENLMVLVVSEFELSQ
jgi:hypothetical protein